MRAVRPDFTLLPDYLLTVIEGSSAPAAPSAACSGQLPAERIERFQQQEPVKTPPRKLECTKFFQNEKIILPDLKLRPEDDPFARLLMANSVHCCLNSELLTYPQIC